MDPFASTDCGETCAASVLSAWGGPDLAPGAIRQALDLPWNSGSTTGAQLVRFLSECRVRARVLDSSPAAVAQIVRVHVGAGYHVVVLGAWLSPDALHWEVAYDFGRFRCWLMDPWEGRYRWASWRRVGQVAAGSVVLVRGRY